jgi:monoamine oxidase
MSRTPLFRLLQRSYRAASYSITHAEPIDELLDRRDAARSARLESRDDHAMSRRQFVAGSAAVAAVAALDACAPRLPSGGVTPRRDDSGSPVLIIGAGIAGLTAGYRLRQAGIPVRIIEAQNRIGGRMYSLRNFFPDGQVCELGGELIDTNQTHIQDMAKELGIELDDLSKDDPSLARDVFYFEGVLRSERDVVDAFVPVARLITADLATLGADPDVGYRDANPAAVALDRLSISQWLDKAGVSGWFRRLLNVAYTTEYGLPPDRQSSLNFLLMIDPDPSEFRMFGESDERYHVHAGNDSIPRALADKLSDAIETNTVLESIDRRGENYVCSLRRGSSSTTATASHVLVAIPFTLLRDVRIGVELPAVKRRAIAELGYGTNAKLMVGFSSRVWRERQKSNGSVLTDLPFQLTWETSRFQSGPTGILTNFTGGAHGVELGQGTDTEQAARLVADLERVFPGATAARVGMKEVRFHWPSFPWTRGSYASYLTGQWTGIAGSEGEAVGGLHFAGEHCSRDAQGFMEGGCETGERAAKEIAEARGKRIGSVRRVEPRRLVAASGASHSERNAPAAAR